MKKFIHILSAALILFSVSAAFAAETVGEFEKYEVISTPTSPCVGLDADALVSYKLNGGRIKAFNIENGKKLFEFENNWKQAAPFYKGKDVVVTDGEGTVLGFVNKNGKMTAEIKGEYLYHSEYSNGMVCLIDSAVSENEYSIFDRNGELIAEHFFEPECELAGGEIIIANAGGGHSLISKDGTVTPLDCKKTVNIRDGVSLYGEVYENSAGSIYSFDGKLIFENNKYSDIAPINRKFAVAAMEGSDMLVIVDFKTGTETPIPGSEFLRDGFFSSGDVSDGRFFLGNSSASVLVDSATGEILSKPVSSYTPFYEKISAVTDSDSPETYKLMKNDGSFTGEDYEYATDMKDGYSLAIKTNGNITSINAVTPSGDAATLYSCGKYKSITVRDDRAVLDFHGDMLSITAQKTVNSAIYIGEMPGSGNIYVKLKSKTALKKIVSTIIAIAALVFVVFAAVDAVKRRKRKKASE